MADDAQTPLSSDAANPYSAYPEPGNAIRSIHWREVFPFLHLFRSFRIAVHPSKLFLGLLGLLALYAGGRILDGFWPAASKPNYNEVHRYEEFALTGGTQAERFRDLIDADRAGNREAYAGLLVRYKVVPDDTQAKKEAADFSRADELKDRIVDRRNDLLVRADKALETAYAEAEKVYQEDLKSTDQARKDAAAATRDQSKRRAQDEHSAAVSAAMLAARDEEQDVRRLRPRGVFDAFFEYETLQINNVITGVLSNNWTAGLGTAEQVNTDLAAAAGRAGLAVPGRDVARSGIPRLPATGVVAAVVNFFITGPSWLIRYHYVYFILYFILFLLVWAVFGGAISRIAAVHAARDEKVSVGQALRFSTNKVLSFVFAPVIPLAIVVCIGLVLAVGGLLFYIPWVGPIVSGALLILALIGGVLITLVLIGTFGGVNLMYPTIAAEGSDSFDAISRSFSYVYARPWRMLFYTAVAVAYGAVTYLFVKLFIYLVLATTHYFVGLWLFASPGRWYPEMWPAPSLTSLPYEVNFTGLKFTEQVAAFLMCFWNYLLIGLLGAFAISFYFSSNTIIYFLMRREVDATELDDVYVEDADDDLSEPAPFGPAGGAAGPAGAIAPGSSPHAAPASVPPADGPVVSAASLRDREPATVSKVTTEPEPEIPTKPTTSTTAPHSAFAGESAGESAGATASPINLSEGAAPAHEARLGSPTDAGAATTGTAATTGSSATAGTSATPVRIELRPTEAHLHGSRLGIETKGDRSNIGFWDSPEESVAWQVHFPEAGSYRFTVSASTAGNTTDFVLEVAGYRLTGRAPATASWDDYTDVDLGRVEIATPGEQEVRLRAADAATWQPMNVAEARVTKVG